MVRWGHNKNEDIMNNHVNHVAMEANEANEEEGVWPHQALSWWRPQAW